MNILNISKKIEEAKQKEHEQKVKEFNDAFLILQKEHKIKVQAYLAYGPEGIQPRLGAFPEESEK